MHRTHLLRSLMNCHIAYVDDHVIFKHDFTYILPIWMICLPVCICTMYVQCLWRLEEGITTLEVELNTGWDAMWVLGTKSESFVRAVCTLNHKTISPCTDQITLYFTVIFCSSRDLSQDLTHTKEVSYKPRIPTHCKEVSCSCFNLFLLACFNTSI